MSIDPTEETGPTRATRRADIEAIPTGAPNPSLESDIVTDSSSSVAPDVGFSVLGFAATSAAPAHVVTRTSVLDLAGHRPVASEVPSASLFGLSGSDPVESATGSWAKIVNGDTPAEAARAGSTGDVIASESPFTAWRANRPRTPMTPQGKRRLRLTAIVAGSAVGVVVLGTVAVSLLNGTRTPDLLVHEYLDNIVAGNATAAARIVDPGVPNDQRVLLSDEALKSTDQTLTVTAVDVRDVSDGGATVEASLSVDGENFTHTFYVASAPKDFVFLNNWRLTEPLLVPVSVSTTVSENVILGDVEIPVASDEEDAMLFAYPGVYTFTGPKSTYYEPEPVTISLLSGTGDGSASVLIEESPSDELAAMVLTAAQNEVTACATIPTNLNELCPSAVQSKDLEVLSLKALPEGFEELTPTRFVTDDAAITIQSKGSSFFSPTPRDVEFSLQGTIEMKDGEPVIEFSSSNWY